MFTLFYIQKDNNVDHSAAQLPLNLIVPPPIMFKWHSFAGGMRDMFDAVLKFGAHIVDALTEYAFFFGCFASQLVDDCFFVLVLVLMSK